MFVVLWIFSIVFAAGVSFVLGGVFASSDT